MIRIAVFGTKRLGRPSAFRAGKATKNRARERAVVQKVN